MRIVARNYWPVWSLVVCVLAVLVYLGSAAPGRTQGVNATVSVNSAVASTNSKAVVDLVVTPEQGFTVGALRVIVTYNDAVLAATACSNSVCNPSWSSNEVALAFANVSGISGVASTITFNTLATEGTANLAVTLTTCADEQGIDLMCGTEDGTVAIANPTPTPTPTPSPTPSQTPPPTPTPSPTQPPRLWGDIDCSGAVNSVDALKLLRWKAGLSVTQQPGCPVIGLVNPS